MSDEPDKNARDCLTLAIRSTGGFLRLVGGPLAELITQSIPRLRQDRIVEYLRQLSERLAKLEQAHLLATLADSEKIDLIEAGGHLAARATTTERLERIAKLVSPGAVAGRHRPDPEETPFPLACSEKSMMMNSCC